MKKIIFAPYLMALVVSPERQMVFACFNCLYEQMNGDLLPFPLTAPNAKRKC